MNVRSITVFGEVGYPVDGAVLDEAGRLARQVREALAEVGLTTQTIRFAGPPLSRVLAGRPAADVAGYVAALEVAARAAGFDVVSAGPVLADDAEPRLDLVAALPDALASRSSSFASVLAASRRGGLAIPAVRASAEVVQALAHGTERGFGNLRFAILANCGPGIPFFPAAYHDGGPLALAFALEAADVADQAFGEAGSPSEARARLTTALEAACRPLVEAAERTTRGKARFLGLDLSPAPFPAPGRSVAGAIERLGIGRFGGPGTLVASVLLTDALRRVRLPGCGFSGLMLPVLEDAVLAERNVEGLLSIEKLLLYSAVCGTGLDTIPLPGETSVDQIAAIALDVCALALALNKPLTARLMPVPGLAPGAPTAFDFPYFANSAALRLAPGAGVPVTWQADRLAVDGWRGE